MKQEKEKEELAKTDVNVPGDEDMTMLISNDDYVGDKEGREKKFTFKKPPLQKCHNDDDISDKEQKRSSQPRNHHHENHLTNKFRLQIYTFKLPNSLLIFGPKIQNSTSFPFNTAIDILLN